MIILRLLLLLTNLHLKLLSTQGAGADKLLSTQRVKPSIMCQLTNPIPLFLHQSNVQRIVNNLRLSLFYFLVYGFVGHLGISLMAWCFNKIM